MKISPLYQIAGKNMWFTSIAYIVPSLLTYLFWFVTGRIVGADAIGIASSIAALIIILSTINVLDMSLGMKRSLSIAIASDDKSKFKQVLISTLLFVTLVNLASSVIVTYPGFFVLESLGIDRSY